MGMLFQIVDDILDVSGDEKTLGKSVGKDAALGKCTYVTLLGMEGAREAARIHADAALQSADGFDRDDRFFFMISSMILWKENDRLTKTKGGCVHQ